jgi:hypothetical protein
VQLVIQKRAFDRSIEQLRSASDARPFPDEARAAAAIAANLKHWSEELAAAARALADRAAQRVDSAALAAWLTGAPAEFTALARELRVAQDGLDRLPKLWGAEVGAALAAGDCAIITGPSGVATVPAWQLVAGASGGSISFDRRFRGEQAIASALRALKVGKPPVAVFVHAGALGILRPSADGSDLAALLSTWGQNGAADINGDGTIDGSDLAILLSNWGTSGLGDINADGIVNAADLSILLSSWS